MWLLLYKTYYSYVYGFVNNIICEKGYPVLIFLLSNYYLWYQKHIFVNNNVRVSNEFYTTTIKMTITKSLICL